MCKGAPCSLMALCLLFVVDAHLWAAEALQGRPVQPAGRVDSIAISPDGRWLVAGSEVDTRLSEPEDGHSLDQMYCPGRVCRTDQPRWFMADDCGQGPDHSAVEPEGR
jgi:hypothetical protein